MTVNFSASVGFPVLISLYTLLVIFLIVLVLTILQSHVFDVDFNTRDVQKSRRASIRSIWAPLVIAVLALTAFAVWFGVGTGNAQLNSLETAQALWITGAVVSIVLIIVLAITVSASRCIKYVECIYSKASSTKTAMVSLSFIVLIAVLAVSCAGIYYSYPLVE